MPMFDYPSLTPHCLVDDLLTQAEKKSSAREREEREEAVRAAEEAGRMASDELASHRPWTRYVFDRHAPLEEEGARPSLAFMDERGGAAEGSGEGYGTRPSDGAAGDGDVNTLSFRDSSQVAVKKQRDAAHEASIFGQTVMLAQTGKEQEWLDVGPSTVMCRGHGEDEDGPVVVTEAELRAATVRASDGDPSSAHAANMCQADQVSERQMTMSWRERAIQARNRKD